MSVSGLISPNNKDWANLYINSLRIYNDLTVDGDYIATGNIAVNGLLSIDDMTVDGVLLMEPGYLLECECRRFHPTITW